MRRREFTTLLGGATVAWSVAAHAQQTERVRRICVLTFSAESDQEGQSSVAAFREGFRSSGGWRAATARSTFAGRRLMSS